MLHCFSCGEPSFPIICGHCAANLLAPTLTTREIGGIKVFSFYKYSEIEKFLLTKHTSVGAKILELLAQESFTKFAENFEFVEPLSVAPIDDHAKSGYSHTAILANALSSKLLKPAYGSLRATNHVSYAGQSLEFRRQNPRNFIFKPTPYDVVLVDDIITTGETIKEAINAIQAGGKETLFALTLADARE
jgi:competence protein ComFC